MIYLELDDDLKKELNEYGSYDWKGYDLNGEEVIKVIEDLLCEIDNLKEEIEDLKLEMNEENRKNIYYDDCYNDMKLGII